jgi:chemotaxis protein MotB
MKCKQVLLTGLSSLLLFSCVSSKKYKGEIVKYEQLSGNYTKLQGDLKSCEDAKAEYARNKSALESEIENLKKQNEFIKQNNTQALKQLQDLSVISSSQAESIKKSLDNIGAKDAYIQDLQASMARKDSLNMALVMNLKGAIGNLADEDINIKVDKGRCIH